MATTAVKIKIMPESPDINLEELKKAVQAEIEESGGTVNNIETQPIAFGLNALIVTFAWPEQKDTIIK